MSVWDPPPVLKKPGCQHGRIYYRSEYRGVPGTNDVFQTDYCKGCYPDGAQTNVFGENEVALARVNKAKLNTEVRPIDMLRALIAEIEAGKAVTKLVIVYRVDREHDYDQGTWRCQVTKDEELAMLQVANFAHLARTHGK